MLGLIAAFDVGPQKKAELRAAGTQHAMSVAIGKRVFAHDFPAQVLKIRVDGEGRHTIAGVTISGVKFKHPIDPSGLTAEVATVVREAFAAAPLEEVDVWAMVPFAQPPKTVVSGEYAQPTSRIVYSATVLRGDLPALDALLGGTRAIFWDGAFRAGLRR